jgi:hypothetical protein
VLYYSKIYRVVMYVWACTNVYYDIQHIVLITALLIMFLLLY